jgi:K+-sensing histidine kinase KdpD
MHRHVTFVVAFIAVTLAANLIGAEQDRQEFEAAKQEHEQTALRDEAARVTYVTKLAQIADRLVSQYRQSGQRNDELMSAINSELQKHPAPKDVDSKKLRQLLIGKWESPRRTYVFRADGKYGSEDGPVDTPWRVQGNQIVMPSERRTIILLNSEYLIYSDGGNVFFHSRVKD